MSKKEQKNVGDRKVDSLFQQPDGNFNCQKSAEIEVSADFKINK